MNTIALNPYVEDAGLPVLMESSAIVGLCASAAQCYREGIVQLERGEPGEALTAFSRTLALAPDFTHAHVLSGIAHARTSQIYPALDHLERAAELEPECFAAHYVLAELSFKLRIPMKGYQAAKRALQCAASPQQRAAVGRLVHDERQREHNGIARPWFNKPLAIPAMFLAASGAAAFVFALLAHLR